MDKYKEHQCSKRISQYKIQHPFNENKQKVCNFIHFISIVPSEGLHRWAETGGFVDAGLWAPGEPDSGQVICFLKCVF